MEIEAKFVLPDATTQEQIAALDQLAGFTLAPGKVTYVRDVYLDTAERALYTAGYACRRRQVNADFTLTLKTLARATDAIHRREEFEIALPGAVPPAEWQPSPARDLVYNLVGDETLVPLFELEQTRDTRLIYRETTAIAELTLDQVRVATKARVLEFRELEVELRQAGAESAWQAIVQALQTRWNLRSEPRSKFERGLEFVTAPVNIGVALTPQERAWITKIALEPDPAGRRARALLALDAGNTPADAGAHAGLSAARVKYWRNAFQKKRLDIFPARWRVIALSQPTPHFPLKPGLTIDDSMAQAARKTLLFHFQRMVDHEVGTRAGQDVEELHDMRVATRRMRAALQVFERYLDADALKPFAKSLRRMARALGAVRDLDVFRAKTQRYLDTLPATRQNELAALLAVWQREYDTRRADMLAHLDSPDYARLKEGFGKFLDTPDAGGAPLSLNEDEPAPYRVRHILPASLFAGYAQVRAYDEWLSQPNVPLARYHQLRIASKRLRYTLEFFQEVLGAPARPLIEKIKRLQDHLGDLQDAVVACNALRDFLTWGMWRGATRAASPGEVIVAPGVAAYLATRQSEIEKLIADFPSVWSDIAGNAFNRQLAELTAVL